MRFYALWFQKQGRSTGSESKRVESGMEIPTKPGDTLLMNNTNAANNPKELMQDQIRSGWEDSDITTYFESLGFDFWEIKIELAKQRAGNSPK